MSEKELDKIQVHQAIKSGDSKKIGEAYKNYFAKYHIREVTKMVQPDPMLIFDGKLPLFAQ